MYDITVAAITTPFAEDALSALRHFVEGNAGALFDAAALLAGGHGVQIVDRIIEGLTRPGALSVATIAALHELRDILALEHVDDLSRLEAHYFLAIDPEEPIVEEICLLTDQFGDALENAGLEHLPASLTRSAA